MTLEEIKKLKMHTRIEPQDGEYMYFQGFTPSNTYVVLCDKQYDKCITKEVNELLDWRLYE